MKKKTNNIRVVATGHYVPSKIVTNKDLEAIIDTNDEWIYTRTGIKARRFAENEDTSDLAVKAALDALESSNVDPKSIDLIICATFTPDYLSPAVSNLVQAKLGLNDLDITCFDVNAACTGFIYALNVAAQMLNAGNYNRALVIGAEVISKVTDFTDRNTCVLFGDGAGAMIIENTELDKPAYFYAASKGDLSQALYVDKYVHMDGKRVYQFATKAIEQALLKVLETQNLSQSDIDIVIPHQANVRIIQSASKSLDWPIENFYMNIEHYGNTSAASIIIALDEYIKKQENVTNKKVILVGFGAGFTWGAAQLTL